jgi:hypothetical protein
MVPHKLRCRLSFLMLAVFLLPADVWAEVKSEVLEGFEQFTSSSKAVTGKFTVVEGKPGVTQGRQALQLKPDASVTIAVKTSNFARLPWLKIDAFVEEKESPSRLRLSFQARNFGHDVTAICRPGQDTLALPLSTAKAGQEWPDEGLKLTLTNQGPWAITLDNVRLEEAEPIPPGATLIDYGPEGKALWPGFSTSSSAISWSGKVEVRSWGTGFPDPLTGYYLAPYLLDRVEDCITIDSPSAGEAWLWVSHYGRGDIQPPEYYLKARGQMILGRRSMLKQLLGPEGLQAGVEGEWTPQWMEKTFVPRIVDLVQVPLQAGKNQIDTCNIQLAAAAMAPASGKAALDQYVKKVKEDLARYRRQFVLGQRLECRSEIEPTDPEVKSGAMLFGTPRGSASQPGYLPKEDARLKAAEGTLYNGGLTVVWAAAVPLKKAIFTGSVSSLQSADGKPLGSGADLWFIERVPCVAHAQASTIPWILRRRLTVAQREVVHLAVVVQAPENAPAGDYSGTIRLNAGAAHAEAPLTVHVFRCGPPLPQPPTFGVMGGDLSMAVYGPIIGPLDARKKEPLEIKLRQDVLALGFNATDVPSCVVSVGGKNEPAVDDSACRDTVRALQGKPLRGKLLIDLSGTLWGIKRVGSPGMARFDRFMSEAVSRSNALVAKAGFADSACFTGIINQDEDLDNSTALNLSVGVGARTAAYVYDTVLTKNSNEKLLLKLQPVSILLVRDGGWSKYMDKVDAWRKAVEGREYYAVFYRPDEYGMGFHSWGQGAKGWYCTGLFDPRPYRGFDFSSDGFLAPDTELSAPCLLLQSVLWMRQGMSDFTLAARAEALVKQAKKAGTDCAELETLLDSIRKDSREGLAYIGARGEDLEKKRVALIQAAAKVDEQLKNK